MSTKTLSQEKLVSIFRTVMDAQRLKVFGALVQGSKSISELVDITGLIQPELQQHLSSLAQAGLIMENQTGQGSQYTLDLDNLQGGIQKYFAQHKGQKAPQKFPDEISEENHDLVKNILNPDGSLKDIPSVKKKKQLEVILDYICTAFEFDKTYTEREVNDILIHYHPDYVTLRRYLVDYQLLGRVRDGSKYWREANGSASSV